LLLQRLDIFLHLRCRLLGRSGARTRRRQLGIGLGLFGQTPRLFIILVPRGGEGGIQLFTGGLQLGGGILQSALLLGRADRLTGRPELGLGWLSARAGGQREKRQGKHSGFAFKRCFASSHSG
jgi:hypothetical protein